MNDPFERELASWLRDGPDRGPDAARERAFAAVRASDQRPAWLVSLAGASFGTDPVSPVGLPPRRMAWLLVALALALVAIIGAAIAGGLVRDPLRTEVPPVVAEATPLAEPSVPPDAAGLSGTIAFSYGGRIRFLDPMTGERWDLETEAPAGCPTFSPDGSAIAYETESGIWVDTLDGAPVHVLSGAAFGHGYPDGERPAWSPDSSRLAISIEDIGMVIAYADGRPAVEVALTDPGETDADHTIWPSSPAWSPIGDEIAVTYRIAERMGPNSWMPGATTLEFVDAATGERRVLPKGAPADVDLWEAGGRTLILQQGGRIRRMDAATGEPVPIAGDEGIPFGDPSDALRMSPDGRRLVTNRYVNDDYRSIVLIDAQTGDIQTLPGDEWIGGMTAWGPDSRHIAALGDTDGRRDLAIVSIEGAEVTRVPLGPAATSDPWSRWWDCVSWTPRDLFGRARPEASLQPDTTAVASFASTFYDYSIEYPADWTATAATAAWAGTGEWDIAPIADVFDPPEPGCDRSPAVRCTLRHLAVSSATVPPATNVDEWIAAHVPERPDVSRWDHGDGDFHPVCTIRAARGNFLVDAAAGNWVDGTIGGEAARIRGQCGFVEGVVIVDERAYVFSLFTDFNPGGSPGELEALTSTVRFLGADQSTSTPPAVAVLGTWFVSETDR